jgi:integrase
MGRRPAEVLQPATVERVYRLAVRIFHAAMRDRLIAIDPCVGVRLPRVEPARVVPLTVGEVERLAGAIAPRYQALVILGATAGLRQGEAFGLTVDRVDFLRRTIKVDRQLVLLPGAPPRFGPPKTRTSHRVVPVDQVTTAALAAHLEEFPTDGVEGLVFTASEGGPLRRNRFSERVWRPAIQASGLPVGVTFHDLRHFYASLLIRYGESITTIQARLGHATAAETLGTYGHLWPDSEDRTRAAVAEAFAGRLVRPTHSLSSPHARRTRGGEAEEVGTVDFAARP